MVSYLTTLFLGRSPEVNLPGQFTSTCIKCPFLSFFASNWQLALLEPDDSKEGNGHFRHLFPMRDISKT